MARPLTTPRLLVSLLYAIVLWRDGVVSFFLPTGCSFSRNHHHNHQKPTCSIESKSSTRRATVHIEESSLRLSETLSLDGNINNGGSNNMTLDRRPHQNRAESPRPARRLNHGFRYLFRDASDAYLNTTAMEYLTQYYTKERVVEMNRTFPPLLDLNVSRHIHPKFRFLSETLHIMDTQKLAASSGIFDEIPPQYFGARLEKTIAPRHAFLVHMNLTHGKELLNDATSPQGKTTKLQEFLMASRKTKRFCVMCNQWKQKQQNQQQNSQNDTKSAKLVTAKQVEAFDFLFGRGILAAARDELVQWNNTWALQQINITSTEIIRLLIQHGANPLERDVRGTTLLHWAAGSGNLDAVQQLLPYFPNGLLERTKRDGATPLHWAAAGANSKEFGTGGHMQVCQFLLLECDRQRRLQSKDGAAITQCTAKEFVNCCTEDGNSPLMWAAWSGSLDTVKLMVRHRAQWKPSNTNGCTVAHWASSGGNLEVCEYLHDVVGVDFFEPNHGGNTPLTHAVAFGRVDVVRWLRRLSAKLNNQDDDLVAAQLAGDFVEWSSDPSSEGIQQRKQVLKLFQDDYWDLVDAE